MDRVFSGYNRKDFLIFAAISLVVFLICGMHLTRGMPQLVSDDFSAYVSEGIAISNGTLKEQAAQNYIQHPSPMPDEVTEKELVYVWGYPLLLSLVHRLVGFDLITYDTFIYYKIPSLAAFALTAGVLYLYYRRFFSAPFAAFLSLFFPSSVEVILSVNCLDVDIVFLLSAMFTLLIAECFLSSLSDTAHKGRKYLLAVVLGFSFWYTYETRLNGNTVILIVAFSHIVHLLRKKEDRSFSRLLLSLLPYVLFGILKFLSELILLPATSNLSDVGNTTFEMILFNIGYYSRLTSYYWMSFFGYPEHPFWIALFALTIIGFVWKAFHVRHLHLTLLLVGTYLVLALLPYAQGLRYLFNVLPILNLFAGYGALLICSWIAKKLKIRQLTGKAIIAVLMVGILLATYKPFIQRGKTNLGRFNQISTQDFYSEEAIDVYQYIQNHTEPESMIATFKPRALAMNTNRICFNPYVNGHNLNEADYFLTSTELFPEDQYFVLETDADALSLVYENSLYSLYSVAK